MNGHNCLDQPLIHKEHSWTETHGLDCGPFEHCSEEWWECAICGEKFTAEELESAMEHANE